MPALRLGKYIRFPKINVLLFELVGNRPICSQPEAKKTTKTVLCFPRINPHEVDDEILGMLESGKQFQSRVTVTRELAACVRRAGVSTNRAAVTRVL